MSIKKFTQESLEMENNGTLQELSVSEDLFDDFDQACHSRVCSGCSCLCDDVSYYVKDGRLVRTLNLCEIAMKRVRSVSADDRVPPLSDGLLAESLDEAAKLLRDNGPPLILGADALDENSVLVSRKLAERLNGIWLPWGFKGIERFYGCVKKYGWASAILDEIRDRADAVIFWRADPLNTHHRHLSRYSYFPRGRYTERGNSDRNLTVIADYEAVIEPLCQQFFNLEASEDSRFIRALMMPPREAPYDHRDFPMLVNSLQKASYIAVFVDPEKTDIEAMCALFEWAESVNVSNRQRMVILPLPNAGSNIEGFTRISLEHHGTCGGFDFSREANHSDEDAVLESAAESAGSVMMIESGPEGAHRKGLPDFLSRKPLVVISSFKQEPVADARISIPLALPGIETDGVFFRADGLPLLTKKIEGLQADDYPTATYVLKEIMDRLT